MNECTTICEATISNNLDRENEIQLTVEFKPRLYALSAPLGVYLPLGVNICPTLLNNPMGKRLRLYVF